MAKRDTFIFHRSWLKATDMLKEPSKMLRAIVAYALDGEEPEDLEALEQGIWICIKTEIDQENERKERIREIRAESGRKGGKKTQAKQANQANARFARASKANEKKDNELEAKQANARFASPPHPPINNINSSSLIDAHEEGKERLLRWMNEAGLEEHTARVQYQVEQKLTDEGRARYEKYTLEQLVTQFYDYDFQIRELCDRHERTAALTYYQNWLPKYINKKVNQANEQKQQGNDNERPQDKQNRIISSVSEFEDFGHS